MGKVLDKGLEVSTFGMLNSKGLTKNAKGIMGQEGFNFTQSQYDPSLQRAVKLLEQRAAGDRPSVAELQMNEGLDKGLSNTVSAIRSSPSVSPALQTRMIARAGQENQSELARAQSILRAGEQAQAEQGLAQTLLGARGQDITGESIKAGAFGDKQKRRSDLFGEIVSGAGQAAMMG
jgi:hypothetical protein